MGDQFVISSELFNDIQLDSEKCNNGRILSKFRYQLPKDKESFLAIKRKRLYEDKENINENEDRNNENKTHNVIEIEYSRESTLDLVGLQIWRGALLLADYLFHHRNELCDKQVLELGAGVGLTSIAAAMYAMRVICTDVNLGGILKLIQDNVNRNRKITKNAVKVLELNFEKKVHCSEVEVYIRRTDIFLAADVIYFDNLTDAFVATLDRVLARSKKPGAVAYVALEKRSAFSTDTDAIPPSFQYFLDKSSKMKWNIENIKLDFPQYFEYDRNKKLVLLKITRIQDKLKEEQTDLQN
ncbi:methyltransferase-like protein 22 [Condylostylus longicornis]|uniref:methyltransferase-like protein 22 n=1 Tax=Condylostylus longicornis TaxID=2530218 RepID=UPI00244E4141|nr:methyltransferase-like protein 22 [Condylostylus longicornis]